MHQAESIIQKKVSYNSYLLVNLTFAFFPISFVAGSLFVNINLLLFCSLGAVYLKSEFIKTKLNFPIKIIFLFFILIIFSSFIGFINSLYLEGFDSLNMIPDCFSTNCFSPMVKLSKSIFFFRFFLLLLTIYLLNKHNILNFKYFLFVASLIPVLISLDIIYQYFFGSNIIGLKSNGYQNSGFFGDEYIAGGFIQRFSFFAIFFSFLIFNNKKYIKFIFSVLILCILGVGVLFAGNKMPLVLYIIGIFLLIFLNWEIKKLFFLSLLTLLILVKFITSYNVHYKSYLDNTYKSFIGQANTMINITGIQKWNKTKRVEYGQSAQSKTTFYIAKHEGNHRRIYLAAIDTWKINNIFEKVFGSGIKSFREDCWNLESQPNTNLSEDLFPGKKNRLCSNHPHNYYLEILLETGVLGIILTLTTVILFIIFLFKNFRYLKQNNIETVILLSAIISLILEAMPFKSTGSLFTTINASYFVIIVSIILCYQKLIKTNA